MGGCASKGRYLAEQCFSDDAWRNWDHHVARNYYEVGKTLGRGAFSEVVMAKERQSGHLVALKVVFLDNPRLAPAHAAILRAEVAIMARLAHPNIARIECVMEDPARAQLVIAEELCHGGTLLEELAAAGVDLTGAPGSRGPAVDTALSNENDRMLAYIFKQLLSALAHCHAQGIVHRDLKPENIMFRHGFAEWPEHGAVPVLIDFGMAARLRRGERIVGVLGSPGYVAPETIRGEPHTPAMDMFSAGVVLFTMLTGHRPMTHSEANTLRYHSCDAADYSRMRTDQLWKSANEAAQDLTLRLLDRDPARRPSAAEALGHRWITADMATARRVASGMPFDMAAQIRSARLRDERKLANVEEFLRLMALALEQRPPTESRRRWRRAAQRISSFESFSSAHMLDRAAGRRVTAPEGTPKTSAAGAAASGAGAPTTGAVPRPVAPVPEEAALCTHMLHHLRMSRPDDVEGGGGEASAAAGGGAGPTAGAPLTAAADDPACGGSPRACDVARGDTPDESSISTPLLSPERSSASRAAGRAATRGSGLARSRCAAGVVTGEIPCARREGGWGSGSAVHGHSSDSSSFGLLGSSPQAAAAAPARLRARVHAEMRVRRWRQVAARALAAGRSSLSSVAVEGNGLAGRGPRGRSLEAAAAEGDVSAADIASYGDRVWDEDGG